MDNYCIKDLLKKTIKGTLISNVYTLNTDHIESMIEGKKEEISTLSNDDLIEELFFKSQLFSHVPIFSSDYDFYNFSEEILTTKMMKSFKILSLFMQEFKFNLNKNPKRNEIFCLVMERVTSTLYKTRDKEQTEEFHHYISIVLQEFDNMKFTNIELKKNYKTLKRIPVQLKVEGSRLLYWKLPVFDLVVEKFEEVLAVEDKDRFNYAKFPDEMRWHNQDKFLKAAGE